MSALDPRTQAFRADLADARLKGQVQAARFVEPQSHQVIRSETPQRSAAASHATATNHLLYGETLEVIDQKDDFCWGRSPESGYVGWVFKDHLSPELHATSHWVGCRALHIFSAPSIKSTPVQRLSRLSRLTLIGEEDGFYRLPEGGFVQKDLLELILTSATVKLPSTSDWFEIAETYLDTPYLWGGRSDLGIDCSGLVQMALMASGLPCPRDSDQQMMQLGTAVGLDAKQWRAGDLLFWPGHVAILRGGGMLLHATAFAMRVILEPLAPALARIHSQGLSLQAVRRI